jgi:hypothetical protein
MSDDESQGDESQETPTIVVPEKNADEMKDLFGSDSDSDDDVKGR